MKAKILTAYLKQIKRVQVLFVQRIFIVLWLEKSPLEV